MATPVVQTANNYSDTSYEITSISVTLGAAPTAGNLLLAFILWQDPSKGSNTFTAATGWSTLPGVTWPLFVYGYDYISGFYRVADGTEGTTISFPGTGFYGKIEFVEVLTGDTSAPFDATCVQTAYAPSYGQTPEISGITTNTANAWVGVYCMVENLNATITPPSTLTNINSDALGTVKYSDTLDGMTQATPGATGTFTYSAPTGYPTYGGITVAVKQPVAGTTIPLSDSGTASESLSISVGGGLSDAGTGADSTGPMAAVVPLSDTGSGTDALSAIAVALALADSGSALDAITVLKSLLISVADSGTATDVVAVSAALSALDTALGVDTVSISALASLSDTGSGLDSVSILRSMLIALADSGRGTDSLSIRAALSLTDQSHAVEQAALVVSLALVDTMTGADVVAVSQQIARIIASAARYVAVPRADRYVAVPRDDRYKAIGQADRYEVVE